MYAPIDLSGIPGYTRVEDDRTHVTAFLGRCSTKDNQNPRTSISGQAALCAARLGGEAEIDAYYWDVESGYLDLDDRSQHDDAYYAELGVPLQRDGGINDLLAAVEAGRITRVVCERSDRAARDLLAILTVEMHLGRHDVELIYATEPPTTRTGAMSASQLQMRRASQVQSELFGRIRMENSERGQREHTAQGWTHGQAPYPYTTVIDQDAPKPNDRFLHRPKRRLQRHPDPRRWDAAERMAHLRLREHAEYAEIRDELNDDLDRYPYDREGKRWPVRRIRALLLNPRLTGYAVFGRRCNVKGWQPNPIAEWAWSRRPAHEAIFSVEDWAEMMRMDAVSRASSDPMERLRAAAAAHGFTVDLVRSDDVHAVYAIGGRQFTVPAAGDLPSAAADRIIAWLGAA
jgi:DNA invertase Pin-like site-specific DNA recombinase